MQQNQRTKMCPNCEGNVALEVSICPYCGGSVFNQNQSTANQKNNENLTNPKNSENVKSLSYEETLASLYPPPYKSKMMDSANSCEPIQENKEIEQKEGIKDFANNSLLPTVLFWVGVNLLIFSLILLIFSKDGFLHLKWNSGYWFLYSLISLPLLYFGFKGLQDLE